MTGSTAEERLAEAARKADDVFWSTMGITALPKRLLDAMADLRVAVERAAIEGDNASAYLRERAEYLSRQEFHPLVWEWWRAFDRDSREFPPASVEEFDEVIAWTLANLSGAHREEATQGKCSACGCPKRVHDETSIHDVITPVCYGRQAGFPCIDEIAHPFQPVEEARRDGAAAMFLRERAEYLSRQEFHPLVWEWWRAFDRDSREFPPASVEEFDEVVAWTLANVSQRPVEEARRDGDVCTCGHDRNGHDYSRAECSFGRNEVGTALKCQCKVYIPRGSVPADVRVEGVANSIAVVADAPSTAAAVPAVGRPQCQYGENGYAPRCTNAAIGFERHGPALSDRQYLCADHIEGDFAPLYRPAEGLREER